MDSIKLHIYVADDVSCSGDLRHIKNCSVDVFKLFDRNRFIESTLQDCDMAILFLDLPLSIDFSTTLEKLWDKKIVLCFCGDSACYFDRLLLNLTNVVAVWCHTIFEDLQLLCRPVYGARYRDYLLLNKTNSYHQKFKKIHIEKVKTFFLPSNYRCPKEVSKLSSRRYDICFLGTIQYASKTGTTGFMITQNKLNGLKAIEDMKGEYNIITGRVDYDKYIDVLRDTKICICAQGWGEFSYKDYEALSNGCVVLKNCDYPLKSSPNIYDRIVYCHSNFDNLAEKICDILERIDDYQTIVNEGRELLLHYDEEEHISRMLGSIIHLYSQNEINHNVFENIFVYQEQLIDYYDIVNSNINFYLKDNIDSRQFSSFGFFPMTDYYVYFQNKCFRNRRYSCRFGFKSNLNKIRYYDGSKWNTVDSSNNEFEIEYEQDFNKYVKSRIGFCYDSGLKTIKIMNLAYSMNFIPGESKV